uniref:Uncharacterized protein n=1 Tax=Octopus bimaculoides TaxID=37653 RepID=A0A0L8HWZ5_OCTBM
MRRIKQASVSRSIHSLSRWPAIEHGRVFKLSLYIFRTYTRQLAHNYRTASQQLCSHTQKL